MKIIPKREVIRRLNKIYSKIPSFNCTHCQQCSNPVMWFKPEELNIKEFLKEHNLSYQKRTEEEFNHFQMKCPYLQNNRCIIYPVRPIVCRLQGLIPELECPNNSSIKLSYDQYQTIISELNELNRDIGGLDQYYGTRREMKRFELSNQKS